VGVVLIVATLITPAAAARQWTNRLGAMVLLSASIGALAGVAGSLASALVPRLPTGPVIVVVSSGVLILSLLFAPRRGLLWAILREKSVGVRIRRENLLKDLYLQKERSGSWEAFVSWTHLMGVRGQTGSELERSARSLFTDGLVERTGDSLRLTPAGLREAESVVRKHRLWEVYLTHRLELPSDHVHRDAEAMEHALTEKSVEALEELLGFPELDPHGKAIPRRRTA
jgi:manganese/zinc/iron transport system permease protein